MARDATELIEVEDQPLPSVVSPLEAVKDGAPQLWDEAPRNLCFSLGFGDAQATRRAMEQALLEGIVFDADSGQVLTGSFADYAITRADALPSFRVALAEDPTSGNPLRVKGGGEAGIMPATAAVVNALCDALSAACANDVQMPATPMIIWKLAKCPG